MGVPFKSIKLWVVVWAATAWVMSGAAAEFRDRFADRETVVTADGELQGNNVNASLEPNEPRHGGKRGGHSLWISWVAPENGLATLDLTGARFDTLLGVYVLEPGNDPELDRLKEVAENDDDRDQIVSRLEFGVRAGQRYEIAVDGYANATGPIQFRWHLEPINALIPRITFATSDRAARRGDSITLALNVGPGDEPKLHWFFNDIELENQEETTLVIPNFQPENVGQYRIRVEVGTAKFFSAPVELQISSEGIVNSLARNKPEDALESGLVGGQLLASGLAKVRPAGLTRGYNGTQIFHTVYAGRDLAEPLHCGIAGGASYWFSYEPPEAGELELDTDGSEFDTVLQVYTFEPPPSGYEGLVPLACDNDSGANGKTSRLRLSCSPGRTYLVVVDGVNGARGLTYLNYRLVTNQVANVPPTLRQPVRPITARIGERAMLNVLAEGTPPLRFRWLKDGVEQLGETNAELALDPLRLEHAGRYEVEVSNNAGSITNPPVSVGVWEPLTLVLDSITQQAEALFAAAGPVNFVVETRSEVTGTNWATAASVVPVGGGRFRVPIDLDASRTGFFRVRFD